MINHRGVQFWSILVAAPLVLAASILILLGGSLYFGILLFLMVAFLVVAIRWGRGHLLAGFAFLLLTCSVAMAYARNELTYLLIALLCALVAVTILIKRSDQSLITFSPFMLALTGFLILFALKGLFLLWRDTVEVWALREALWYILLGFVTFLCGYGLKFGQAIGKKIPLAGADWTERRLKVAFALCATVGIASFLGLMRIAGIAGYSQAFANLLQVRLTASSGGLAYLLYSMQGTLQVAALLLFIELLRNPRRRALHWFGFGVFCLLVCGMFWPFAIRGLFLAFVGGLGIAFNFLKRRIKTHEFVLAAIVLAIFVVGYGRYRHVGGRWESVKEVSLDLSESSVVDGLMNRFDALDNFARALERLPATPVKLGPLSFFMGVLLRPVPRAFLPSKRLESGSEITSILWPNVHETNVNFEFSIVGEMYFYFSIFGVIFGMMVYGFLVRILQEYFERNYSRPDFQLHYSLIALTPVSWLLAGLNSGATISLVYFSTVAWLVLWYLNAGKRRALFSHARVRRDIPGQAA